MLKSQGSHRLSLLKWSLLILLLTMRIRPADTISICGSHLIIPIGIHLALHYGRTGLLVLALAGFPLVIPVGINFIWSSSDLGLYLASLTIAGWLHTNRSKPFDFPRLRLNPWMYLGLMLFPLYIGMGASDFLWMNSVRWVVRGQALFFLLVFFLGISRASLRPVLTGLIVAVVGGILMEAASLPKNAAEWIGAARAQLPLIGLTDLRPLFLSYRFDTPAELLTAFGFLFFGRFIADQKSRDALPLPSSIHAVGFITAFTLLALGGQINAAVMPNESHALQWAGSFYALLLAGMMAGFYFGFAGILGVLFAVTGFWWIDAVLRADFNLMEPQFYYRVDDLLSAFGFGLVGIRLRDSLTGTATPLWSGVWFRYLVLLLLVLISAIPFTTRYALWVLTMAFLAAIAASLGVRRCRARLTGKAEITLKGGFLSIATFLLMGYLVYSFGQDAWQMIGRLFQQVADFISQLLVDREPLKEEDFMMSVGVFSVLVATLLVTLWLVTTTLKDLLKATGQLTEDLNTLYRKWRVDGSLTLKFGRGSNEKPSSSVLAEFQTKLFRTMDWFNRLLLCALVVIPVTLAGYNYWLDYQKDLARERRYRKYVPPPQAIERQREEEKPLAQLVDRLVNATQRVFKEYPDLNIWRRIGEATVTTGWYENPAEPGIRRRARIAIRPARSFRTMRAEQAFKRSIHVDLYRLDRGRFNLWVEHLLSPDREGDRQLENEIESAIVSAALAANNE